MAFNWQEYLKLASYLKDNSEIGNFSKEAALRSAVSRAYYAAFCHARKYAIVKLNYVPRTFFDDNEHRSVRECFKRHGQMKIAQPLDRLRQFRNNCDYDEDVENLGLMPGNVISLADRIIKDLKIA